MTQRELINLGDNGEWRALSSLDMVGDTVYFTAAYDGEELGHAVDVTDTARAGRANSAAFKSLVGKWDLGSGSAASVLGRFNGLNLEGISVVVAAADAPDGATRLLLASDDEALGCMVAEVKVVQKANGEDTIEHGVVFRNIGAGASQRNETVQVKHWGASGLCAFAAVRT